MSSWSKLPTEVLQQILKLLIKTIHVPEPKHLTDVFQCMLVCKDWKLSGQTIYYSTFQFKDNLYRFIDAIEKYPLLGEYVKSISYDNKINVADLKRLAVILPNLEHINTRPDQAFYTGLIQLNDANRWNYLKSIPYPEKTKDIDLYIMCALEYRYSLTSIVLSDKLLCGPGEGELEDEDTEEEEEEENKILDEVKKEEPVYSCDIPNEDDLEEEYDSDENCLEVESYFDDEIEFGDEGYEYTEEDNEWFNSYYGEKKVVPKKLPKIYEDKFKILSECLNKFHRLERLYIVDRHSDKGIEFYDNIINKCKSLKSIHFEIRPVCVTKASTLPDSPLDLRKIKPKRNIKELIVEGSLIHNDNSLIFIMHKFPALNCIRLNHSEQLFRYEKKVSNKILASKESFSPDVIANFLLYIEKIPVHHLGLFFTKADIALCMKEYVKNHGILMKPLTIYNGVNDRTTVADIEISNCSRLRSCPPSGDISIIFQNTARYFYLPKLIKTIGPYLTKLHFKTEKTHSNSPPKKSIYPNTSQVLSGYFLDLFFLHCPNLTQLHIEGAKLAQCDPEMSISDNISHMIIENTELDRKILPKISIRLPSLKILKLRFCKFDDIGQKGFNDTRNFFFDMPDTCLDTFEIFGGMKGIAYSAFKYTCLYIKVQTKQNPFQYFGVYSEDRVKKSRVERINEAQYLTYSRLPHCALYSFQLESLKKIKISDCSGTKSLICEIDLTDI